MKILKTFLIKVIYNILCIIKNYINFGNYSFSFKQIFSNLVFCTIQSKTPRKISKKLIKLKNTQNLKKGKNKILKLFFLKKKKNQELQFQRGKK